MAPISVSLALEALREQCEAVREAEAVLARERAIRNNLIRDAMDQRVPAKRLIKTTNLSRDRLYTIGGQPYEEVDE
jgi:hypothetical protein